jgi:hypothetical protein
VGRRIHSSICPLAPDGMTYGGQVLSTSALATWNGSRSHYVSLHSGGVRWLVYLRMVLSSALRSAVFSKGRFSGTKLHGHYWIIIKRSSFALKGCPAGRAIGVGVHEHTAGKWQRRFGKDRIEGLADECRSGWPCTVSYAQVAAMIAHTLNTTPKMQPVGRSAVCPPRRARHTLPSGTSGALSDCSRIGTKCASSQPIHCL